MQYFARKGLLADISDLWRKFEGFSDAVRKQSTGEDGKQYFVPYYYYPWAVFHRKSVFRTRGYEIPENFDQYRALARQMQKDGLTPFAFGDKEGWPAMGTFDYLDMRANGYDFHIALMRGEKSWTSPQVRQVFDLWRSCCRTTRKVPTAGPGRRRRSPSRGRKPVWRSSDCSTPASRSPRRTARTWTSSRSPRSTRPSGKRRSRRRWTAS